MLRKIKILISENKALFILLSLLSVVVMAPSLKAGICLTDELSFRLINAKGFLYASKDLIEGAKFQGRVTSSWPHILFTNIQFAFTSPLFFKGVAALILISNFALVSYFIYKVMNNKKYAYFLFVFLVACLPFTFEHVMPNGFVGYLVMPANLLLLSFLTFMKYLKSHDKRWHIPMALCLFLALCSYELFITYTPVFLFLILWAGRRKISIIIKELLVPFCVSVVYLFIYFFQRVLYPTNYSGNALTFDSLGESLTIIINLFKTGIPGYFSTTDKYQYIYHSAGTMADYGGVKEISYFINYGFSLRIFMIIAIVLLLMALLCNKSEVIEKLNGKFWLLGIALLYMFLPSVPNSLSAAYQGTVHEGAFMALPVSYFLYIAGSIIVTVIFWLVMEKVQFKLVRVVLMLSMIVLIVFVQAVNEKVLDTQKANYEKYLLIEEVLGSEVVRNCIEGKRVWAEDLHSTVAGRYTYLTLIADAIHNYETEFIGNPEENHDIFAQAKGTENSEEGYDVIIRRYQQGYFAVMDGEDVHIISKKPLTTCVIEYTEGQPELVDLIYGRWEGGLCVYEAMRRAPALQQ